MFIIIPLIPIFVGINNFVSVFDTLLKKVVLLESTFNPLSSTMFTSSFQINLFYSFVTFVPISF